jgi:NAD(P)-dependent dehydrogenase (short-subunit alcohol dehydrogenase family)
MTHPNRPEVSSTTCGAVVVSGASRGVGRVTAELLAKRGYRVYAGVRGADEVGVWSGAQVDSGHLIPVALDVTKRGDIEALVDRLAAQGPLRALVSVAGLAQIDAVEHIDVAAARRLFEVNVFGALELTQALLPRLKHAGARMVFVSSMAARVSAPLMGCYAASKSALEAWVDALRIELRPWGAQVALVEPGGIRTAMVEESLAYLHTAAERSAAEGAGSQPYAAAYRLMAESLLRSATRHLTPEQVALVLAGMVEAARLPARRLLGSDARVTPLLRCLPDSWLDALMARQFGLSAAHTQHPESSP